MNKKYITPDRTLLNEEHVRQYRATDGEVGHIWNGATVLLLTTTGRKSGQQRTTPLIYGRDGDDYLVVASKGGAPAHPNWYMNLQENAEAEIQVLDKEMSASARTAEGAERERLWRVMTDVWPNYDQYAERTSRRIPLVILTPNP